jgi:rubrerythrin
MDHRNHDRHLGESTHRPQRSEAVLSKSSASDVSQAPASATKAGQTVWTCPMHPEIRRNAPGHCPICGMSLEPLLPGAEDNTELKDMSKRFWIAASLWS